MQVSNVKILHIQAPESFIWTLQGIYVKKDSLGKKESLNIDDIGECKYIVKKTESNVTKSKPVITSVSLDKNGEMLSAGDKVNITIGAVSDEGKLNEYGHVSFFAVSNIANRSKEVDVHYDEEKGVYEGVLEVTKDTYPCEWYVGSVWIKDTENNYANYNAFIILADYPYYIQVTNGNTFVNPTYRKSSFHGYKAATRLFLFSLCILTVSIPNCCAFLSNLKKEDSTIRASAYTVL